MTDFKKQPSESRALFSPSYCALIIANFIDHYQKKSGKSIPPALIHIILPLILNEDYASCFLNNSRKNFFHIVESNRNIYSSFPLNYFNSIEITNNALLFLAEAKILSVQNGTIELNDKFLNKSYFKTNLKYEFQTSNTISNSISKIDDVTGIFITLGINP
ncbi:hypothetical protein F951_02201 [Acinetobacter soli CIP 110264]|uniref:three component ABC system middle component n=1 Tax=Acinetobacter soli TaxID=487316 RepID=UPI0002CDE814|nr:three component ABC system middle component [Acinetobacter soli]ENV56503.1 hypothetical protein F951_02201 [Acinetobacter soli CIP 110264]